MKIDRPYLGELEIPDDSIAELKTLHGIEIVVIDKNFYFDYNAWHYANFCANTSYNNVTDMLPDYVDVKPIKNNTSLLAYAYNNKHSWKNIDQQIKHFESEINKLKELK